MEVLRAGDFLRPVKVISDRGVTLEQKLQVIKALSSVQNQPQARDLLPKTPDEQALVKMLKTWGQLEFQEPNNKVSADSHSRS